jgi:hypothetical protein
MSISTAEPRLVAGKIASAHNRRECKHCRRPFPDGGVLAFGLSGSDVRWYPDEDTARREHRNGVRYFLPVRPQNVTPDEMMDWIEQQREELDQLVEYVEQQREERRAAREMRAQDHGFRTDPFPCADCAKYGVTHYKNRPADRCDRCGDEPCPIGIDHHDYNRGYGYRD